MSQELQIFKAVYPQISQMAQIHQNLDNILEKRAKVKTSCRLASQQIPL